MATIGPALHDLLNENDLPLEEAVARHFSDDYRQRTNGTWTDRVGFTQHIAHLRTLVRHVDVRVVDEFVGQRSYADRHIATIEKNDGTFVVHEVYLFGECAQDGRFRRVEEVTLMLSGDEALEGRVTK